MSAPIRFFLLASATAAFGALILSAPASAVPVVPTNFVDEGIASLLHHPSCMTFLPDGRILYTGHADSRISLLRVGPPAVVTTVGDIDSVRVSGEQGLFGIAVDPRWPASPYVYVHYAYSGAPRIHLARFTLAGDLNGSQGGTLSFVPFSRRDFLVSLPDSGLNHNGGQVHFGPDSLLYASLGDDLRSCGAQAKSRLIGKILRLEVRNLPPGGGGPAALATITPASNPFAGDPDPHVRLVWAYGLRNPYSFWIDRPTGDVVIADVGSAGQEEVDLATTPGLNFGWPLFEGYEPRIPCQNADTTASGTVAPIYAYERSFEASAAIVCGVLYRPVPGGASNFPAPYWGNIFFNDVYHGYLRRIASAGGAWSLADPVAGQPNATDWGSDYDGVTSYRIGPDGALWYSKYAEQYDGHTGEIRRIRWTGPPATVPPRSMPGVHLESPVPSPARDLARLAWTLERESVAALEAYDVRGTRVRRIVARGVQSAGPHGVSWDLTDDSGRPLPAGLYFVRLLTSHGHDVQRLIVAR